MLVSRLHNFFPHSTISRPRQNGSFRFGGLPRSWRSPLLHPFLTSRASLRAAAKSLQTGQVDDSPRDVRPDRGSFFLCLSPPIRVRPPAHSSELRQPALSRLAPQGS